MASTDGRVTKSRWRRALLLGSVVLLLLAGAGSIAVGTALGLANPKDVGYPDSATLLRIAEVSRGGQMYPDLARPPYQVTMYGPLTYLFFALPYRLASAVGIAPEVLVRLSVVVALCVCLFLLFRISGRLYGSPPIAWLGVLFAVSALPLANWTTQIRGDFPGLALVLLGVYWFLRANGRPPGVGFAICLGLALLVKPTFVAAPLAIVGWLIYKRRYKEAVISASAVALTFLGGYAAMWWREPLLLKHIAALRQPVVDNQHALGIIWRAATQPAMPFVVLGVFFAFWNRVPEQLLFLIYCIATWLAAIFAIQYVGGNINYFWEPLLTSAVLAGPGLWELKRNANRAPAWVAAALFVLIVLWFLPKVRGEVRYLQVSYAQTRAHQARKAGWESFLSAVSGRRLLSTEPQVTVLSAIPEIPDPFENAVLELGGRWSSRPVVAQMNAGAYDLILLKRGQSTETDFYRGIRIWSDGMWSALKTVYGRACVIEDMEVWLPQRSPEIPPSLAAIGCRAAPEPAGSHPAGHALN